jgi:hypothetical protein
MEPTEHYHYWVHWHNWKYEFSKRLDRFYLYLARHSPARFRMWVVVDCTNEARVLHPHPSGYSGPDGLGYKEIYDGALRGKEI